MGNISRKIAGNFSAFLRFLDGNFFRKSLIKSEWNDLFQRGKILKIIEHDSNSNRCCKISLLLYTQGAVAFQTPGLF